MLMQVVHGHISNLNHVRQQKSTTKDERGEKENLAQWNKYTYTSCECEWNDINTNQTSRETKMDHPYRSLWTNLTNSCSSTLRKRQRRPRGSCTGRHRYRRMRNRVHGRPSAFLGSSGFQSGDLGNRHLAYGYGNRSGRVGKRNRDSRNWNLRNRYFREGNFVHDDRQTASSWFRSSNDLGRVFLYLFIYTFPFQRPRSLEGTSSDRDQSWGKSLASARTL